MAVDIVGQAGVDIIPILPTFHEKLKAAIIPIADRVGLQAGRVLGERMGEALRVGVAGAGEGVGRTLGQEIAAAMQRRIAAAVSDAVREGGRRATPSAAREGEQTGGAFARSLKARLEAAYRAMPKLDVQLSTSRADADLAYLRARIEQLAGKRVGIDVSVADASAEIAHLDEQLRRLGAAHPNPAVRVDTATARAALAEVQAEIQAIDARDPRVRVHVDTSGALSSVLVLSLQLATLALTPAFPILTAGVGAFTAALTASLAGLGAFALAGIPAVMGVAKAMEAQKAAQEQATSATTAGANADVTAQQRALSLAGAQQSLASAKRSAAQQTESANRQIAQAEQALTDAVAQAQDAQQRSVREVADAVAQAADAQEQAMRRVEDAGQSLADAQRTELQAQDALTQARKTAAQQLEDLQSRLSNGALDERAAALRVTKAEQDLQAVRLAGAAATKLQRDEAQLSYDQALQAQRDQRATYARLQQDAKAATDAGVDGADVVVQAEDRVAQARQRTAEQAQALADAQTSAAKSAAKSAQQVADAQASAAKSAATSARSVADAQDRVAEAQKAAATAAQNAAEAVVSAQRGVQQAMLSTEKSAGTAVTAADKYDEALRKLSPSARQLFDAIAGPHGLKVAFREWSDSVAPDVLPIFVRGVDAAKGTLPGLTPLARSAARAIGSLMDTASAELKSPFWLGFKADIRDTAEPAIIGLGKTFGNILKGMAGIVDGFLPHMDAITSRLVGSTGRFAAWGAGLKSNPEFEKFLDNVARMAPPLAEALKAMASAFVDVSHALGPLSGPVLEGLTAFSHVVSKLATDYPWLIQAIWLGIAAFKVMRLVGIAAAAGVWLYNVAAAEATAETTAWGVAAQATGIVPLIELIVVAIAALVIGVIYAYNHWGWFRTAVVATWDAIKVAALFVWGNVLKPAFEGIWISLQAVGLTAMWLWENAIGPAFQFIWEAAKVLFAIVVTVVIGPMLIAFNLLSALVMWLWRDIFQPSFEGIATVATWLWRNILSPYIDAWIAIFKALGELGLWLWRNVLQPAFEGIGTAATWLWKNAIKPAFDGIATAAGWLWENALKPAFEAIKSALTPVAEAFGKAKDLIGEAWGKLMDITKKPVNFVIQSVYTDGIKAVWDKVADFVHLPKLPDAPKLLAAGGTVGNGWGPAVPMVTNRPTAIVGEGNPNFPEYVIPTDPKYRARALALHSAAGSQLMADGGIIGSIWGGIKGAAGQAWDWAKDGADFLTNPAKIWETLTKPVRDLFSQIGDSPMAKTVTGIPEKVITSLKDKVVNFLGGGSSSTPAGNGGAGVQQWAPIVLQALTMLGQPASWLDTVLRRMNQESGGNPNIVNNWDTNAAAGTPSVGLMQVIGPTFRAYADQFRDVGPFSFGTSTNPLANVYAGLNYAVHRYGSLSALNRPGGYDDGGYLPTGTSLVYNHTGRPEPVFTTGQWDAIRNGGLHGSGDISLEAHVYVGDREITDIVRVEVTRAETATANALTIGRRI
ncbi:transglycosylase SLT domain-containing protein [Kitasatospora sp. NPDC086009]|uniref:transglycosylase SLT domain-containing protein n=1 Tax=unclassified Kitasatospora TaxID=2633591 RepID=UPI0037CC9D5B